MWCTSGTDHLVPRIGLEPYSFSVPPFMGHHSLGAAVEVFQRGRSGAKPLKNKKGLTVFAVSPCNFWWAVQDLNLWPPPCEGGALPAELTARLRGSL